MRDKHSLETYEKLAIGGIFYLEASIRYLNTALKNDFATILFNKALKDLEPNESDKKIIERVKLPENHIEVLQSEIPDILTNETIKHMEKEWENARKLAESKKHKFSLDHRIESIEILGHLNNYGFFLETLINRHLLYLNQTGLIDNFSYRRISVAKIMERIIYIFKDDLQNNTVQLNEIQNLFRLRNKTVHFTPDNAQSLKPRISELNQIWNQTNTLLKKLEKIENFNEEKFSDILEYYTKGIKNTWC